MLLYFYAAALIGLGFVVTGVTMGLFGAKNALLPTVGLSSYSYDYRFGPQGTGGFSEPTEQQRQDARNRAIDDRRSSGLNGLLDGLIITGVGAPVLIWHFKRARALGTAAEQPAS